MVVQSAMYSPEWTYKDDELKLYSGIRNVPHPAQETLRLEVVGNEIEVAILLVRSQDTGSGYTLTRYACTLRPEASPQRYTMW